METIKPIILLLVAGISAVFIGCTHNDGDIGPFFGTWKLESVTIDGTEDSAYREHNIFWQFQSSVFCMRRVYSNHNQENSWATWYDADGFLYVDYSHSDDSDNTGRYTPFAEMHFESGLNRLEIKSLSRRKMRLEMVSPSGTVCRYTLKKWK